MSSTTDKVNQFIVESGIDVEANTLIPLILQLQSDILLKAAYRIPQYADPYNNARDILYQMAKSRRDSSRAMKREMLDD